ncbi:FAD-dependent oxidoreductase [Amycolatopsis jiangsuensis]|uniref:Tetracenomycin A2 monooxygenase-dioxygenase n=1 Tax=Amycolatopsis jiangsuensis TaxID=1181879 RepID=A0A840J2R7_9PSEU|nr:FAD-dependent oxidoreductase [Amycolatopsis jiangsuensis]MBB4688350.1 tetracenomycin A2 monooxygenase-dioxygenase [Amycolatopsis jiangsuensis]
MIGETSEVIVVGAGPVGLSTALFLADRGVRVTVLEKRDSLAAAPRAGTSVRTLELFRSIGLGAELDRRCWDGPAPFRSVVKDSAIGAVRQAAALPERYARLLAECSPIGIRRTTTQCEVQQLALEQVRQRGGRVRLATEVVDVALGADEVRVETADAGTLVCRYLIGADGARSRVRDLLGIPVADRQVAARLNTAFFRADLHELLPESSTHACFIRNEHVYCTLFAKGGDRWSSHLMDYPGKSAERTVLSPERTIHLLHQAIGKPVPIELLECNAWEAAIGMAGSFRRGRAFLAGDAAHVQSSAGGLGMNTGIQDGHNLAWKLAEVLRGTAGESLVDSYEPERRAAAEASLALSHRVHRGYQSHEDVQQLYARLAEDYLRGMLFYRYPAEGDDAVDILRNQTCVGARLPHRWLDDGEVSTLDLVGAGWTLLTGSGGAGWQAAADQLDVRQIAGFTELSGTGADGAVLVRPDGFVAWRAQRLPADPAGAVRSMLRGERRPPAARSAQG